MVDMRDTFYGWSEQPADTYARALQRANQAIRLNPNQPYAHYVKATLLMYKLRKDDTASANETITEAEASLRPISSFALAYLPLAVGEELLGRYEQGLSNMEPALRISPRDPAVPIWRQQMGRELLGLRRYDATIPAGLKASASQNLMGYLSLAGLQWSSRQSAGSESGTGRGNEVGSQNLGRWVSGTRTELHRLAVGFRDRSPEGRAARATKANL